MHKQTHTSSTSSATVPSFTPSTASPAAPASALAIAHAAADWERRGGQAGSTGQLDADESLPPVCYCVARLMPHTQQPFRKMYVC